MEYLSRLVDRVLPVGPRSVLFGAHQFLIHPFYVNKAWVQLYKSKPTWRDRVAFFLHDLGYLCQWCRSMDGSDGLLHPEWGARATSWLFDSRITVYKDGHLITERGTYWYNFCAGHSRHYAEHIGISYSPLMRPDKLATHLYPRWLYGLLMFLSDEYKEYIAYWISKGNYPGTPTDSAWTYAGHLQAEWKRFNDLNGSVHGKNGAI